jgi:hypothetical protein
MLVTLDSNSRFQFVATVSLGATDDATVKDTGAVPLAAQKGPAATAPMSKVGATLAVTVAVAASPQKKVPSEEGFCAVSTAKKDPEAGRGPSHLYVNTVAAAQQGEGQTRPCRSSGSCEVMMFF